MATGDFTEVLRIVIEQEGDSEIGKLAKAMLAAGEAGEVATQDAQRFADALAKVADEAADTRALEDAVARYADLAAKQGELSDATERAGLKLRLATEAEQSAAAAVTDRARAVETAKAAQADYAAASAAAGDAVRAGKEAQKEANTEWRASAAALKSATAEYERAAGVQGDFGEEAERAGLRLKLATEQEAASAAALRDRTQELDAARAAQRGYADGQDAVKDAVRAAVAAQKEANTEWRSAKSDLAGATAEYDKAATSQSRLADQIGEMGGKIEAAGLSTKDLAGAQSELSQRTDAAAQKMRELAEQTSRGGRFTAALRAATEAGAKGFASLRGAVNDLGSSLLRITGIAGAVSAALGAIGVGRLFGGAVASAREFGATLSEVQAVSGATAEELQQLKEAAERVASTTKFSANEAAQGLGELARATGSAQAAMDALPATMELAQAAGYGVADSAALITTTLTQFGLAATEAGRVSDVLAKAANATTADVQGLGNALSYAAPLAKQLGMDFEQTTAIIGAMADQGFRGERAGTALRNVFSALLDPASQFKQALLGLGIESNNFGDIIEGLAQSGDRGRQAILQLDAAARPAILALVGEGGAAIRGLTGDLKNSAGAARETASVMADNFEGAASRLGGALDAMRRALVDPILEPLKVQLDDVAARIRAFIQTAEFGRIKDAIRDFAVNSAAALREFASSIDWSALATSVQSFAGSVRDALGTVKDNASALGTTLSAVGNTISLFWNALQTTILGAAAGIVKTFAMMQSSMLAAAEGAALLTGQSAQLAPVFDEMRTRIGGLHAVAEEFWARTKANAGETAGAFRGLSANLGGTKDAADEVAPAVAALGDSAQLTAEQAERLRAGFGLLPKSLQDMVEPALRTAGVMGELKGAAEDVAGAATKSTESLAGARDDLNTALAEYTRLAKSGTATAEELQRAGIAVSQAEGRIKRLSATADESSAATEKLRTAYAALGISSQRDLQMAADSARNAYEAIVRGAQQGTESQEDVIRSFRAWAEAARTAAAESGVAAQAQVEAQIQAQASALGLTKDLQNLGGAGAGAGSAIADGFAGAESVVRAVGDAADQVSGKIDNVTGAVEGLTESVEAYRNPMAGFALDMSRYGEIAVTAFRDAQRYALDGITSVDAYRARLNDANQSIIAAWSAQREEAYRLSDAYESMTEASLDSLARQSGGYEALLVGIRQTITTTRDAAGAFNMLNDADLGRLQSAARAVEQRLQSIIDRANQARDSMSDMADSLQDQIDQMNGAQDRSETRRFQNQLEQMRQQAEAAGILNSQEYREAVARATELHNLKMKQIRDEAAARANADAESDRRARDAASRADSRPSTTPDAGAKPRAEKVDITLNGKDFGGINPHDNATIQRLAQSLLPEIMRQIQSAARNSGRGY